MNRIIRLGTAITAPFVLAGIVSAQLANSPWPDAYGGVSNSNYSPIKAAAWEVGWTSIGSGGAEGDGIAVDSKGTIYACGMDGLRAINPDGSIRWVFQANQSMTSYRTPAVGADGTIYVSTLNGGKDNKTTFYAVNPNGTLRWSHVFTGSWQSSSPTIDRFGNLYVTTDYQTGAHLYSLNPATGKTNWSKPLGSFGSSATVAIDTMDRIIVGSSTDNHLDFFDTTGKLLKQTSIGNFVDDAPAVASDNTVYIGSVNPDDMLYAINPTGSIKWQHTIDGGLRGTPAIAPNGMIYAVSSTGSLFAYQPGGMLSWKFTPSGSGNSAFTAPLVDGNGIIYYTYQAGFYSALLAINPDGTERYQVATKGFNGPLAIGSSGQIYMGSGGTVVCLVPEPSTLIGMGFGVLALFKIRKRSYKLKVKLPECPI